MVFTESQISINTQRNSGFFSMCSYTLCENDNMTLTEKREMEILSVISIALCENLKNI